MRSRPGTPRGSRTGARGRRTRRASATRLRDAPSISPICAIPPATSCARRTRFRAEMGEDRAPAYVLTFSCVYAVGIVAAVTGLLAERDGFILVSPHYAPLDSELRRPSAREIVCHSVQISVVAG